LILAERVSKSYRESTLKMTVLRNLTLSIDMGEIVFHSFNLIPTLTDRESGS
jgi:hypothetical protein